MIVISSNSDDEEQEQEGPEQIAPQDALKEYYCYKMQQQMCRLHVHLQKLEFKSKKQST
ncbi:hypothetical protein WOLCODRAFT_155746 [Wolfiporia cocos MD-104 SS10]|uniref:Uncharacterized protein n=1 Tax=Wolfiporia cocos (strain MD-104) TaxID=742152 RepID=A0A2H3IYN8_WOLCO|nr:hypothetical protein WOLCODRAFT_155746 [Wolfiporia cocos MD-104 SS10]